VLRIGYCCRDVFPSHQTHTQQIFWTLCEVARLGVQVELTIPALRLAVAGEAAREALATYYGAAARPMPAGFSVCPVWPRPRSALVRRGWFDWRAGQALARRGYDFVWTRELATAGSCLRAGLSTLFETYRPDFATSPRFAFSRRPVLQSPRLLGVVGHSRLAVEAFLRAGLPESHCLVAYNGYAPEVMEPRLTQSEARARLGLPSSDPLVVYTGHAGKGKGIDAVVRMAAAVPEALFVIVGVEPRGSEASRITKLMSTVGAENVLLRVRVNVAEVSAYLYAADCLIVPPTDTPLRRFRRTVLPMKVFSYLAAGRPILAPRLPDIEEVLSDGDTALLVTPGDVSGAASALRRLLADRSLQDRLAIGGLAASRRFTWERRARRIMEFIEQTLRMSDRRPGASRPSPATT
jgi:glycosyltransferase involved in cell wall biosynthesis